MSKRRCLVWVSVVLLGLTRLGLWGIPFWIVRGILKRVAALGAMFTVDGDPTRIDRVSAAVLSASPYVPSVTCLTQALATQVLLGWRGYRTRLCIGVSSVQPFCGSNRSHSPSPVAAVYDLSPSPLLTRESQYSHWRLTTSEMTATH